MEHSEKISIKEKCVRFIKRFFKNLPKLFFVFFLSLCVLEFVLRLYHGMPVFGYYSRGDNEASMEYKLYQDHMYFDFEYQKNASFGAFKTNSLGYLGDEIGKKGKNTVRIFCFGASTTAGSLHMPFEEKYPWLVKEALAKQYPEKKIEVVVVAAPSYRLIQSFNHFATKVIDLEPDIITIYHAINDMGYNARFWKSQPYYSQNLPKPSNSLFARSLAHKSALFRSLFLFYRNNRPDFRREFTSNLTEENLEDKIAHDIADEDGIRLFREYYRNFLILAKARNINVCVGTFAAAVHPKMTLEEKRKMNFLYGHWSTEGMCRNLDRYNAIIRELALEYDACLADAHPKVPHEEKYFIDAVHLKTEGFKVLGEVFAGAIINAHWDILEK